MIEAILTWQYGVTPNAEMILFYKIMFGILLFSSVYIIEVMLKEK